jgi:hypothetical protein
LATSLGSSSGVAIAADQPDSQPSPAVVQEELVPDLPEFPPVWSEPPEPLRLFLADPLGPQDKGGAYTDMGAGHPGRLTPREEALLALGRAAIEASRAAGTLEIRRSIPSDSEAGDLGDGSARTKEEMRLRSSASAPVLGTGSPADFTNPTSGADPAGGGHVGPTTAELAKLAAIQGQTGLVLLAPPAIQWNEAPIPMSGTATADGATNGEATAPAPAISQPQTEVDATTGTAPTVEEN